MVLSSSQLESFYDRLYNDISNESVQFRRLVESVNILENTKIIQEENNEYINKTLMDRLKILFRKVCIFFLKVKNESYNKYLEMAKKQLKSIDQLKSTFYYTSLKDLYSNISMYYIKTDDIEKVEEISKKIFEATDKLRIAYQQNGDLNSVNDIIKDIDLKNILNDIDLNIERKQIELPDIRYKSGSRDQALNTLYTVQKTEIFYTKNILNTNLNKIEAVKSMTEKEIIKKLDHNGMIMLSKIIDFMSTSIKITNKLLAANIKVIKLNANELVTIMTDN